jgi:hypothetical protein
MRAPTKPSRDPEKLVKKSFGAADERRWAPMETRRRSALIRDLGFFAASEERHVQEREQTL